MGVVTAAPSVTGKHPTLVVVLLLLLLATFPNFLFLVLLFVIIALKASLYGFVSVVVSFVTFYGVQGSNSSVILRKPGRQWNLCSHERGDLVSPRSSSWEPTHSTDSNKSLKSWPIESIVQQLTEWEV